MNADDHSEAWQGGETFDRIQIRIEECRCGHDKSSHYRLQGFWTMTDGSLQEDPYGACLGRGCNCQEYGLAKRLQCT